MKNLCIIPARGGSKRIPRKNIKPFMGKPIMAYSIEAALKSGIFDEVMVSTDDEEFAEVARQYGAKVPFMRSAATANDYATTEDVLIEVLDEYKKQGREFDNLCCLYSTAPFVTSERLSEAYSNMQQENADAIFTVVAYSYPIQRCLHIVDGKIGMKWPEYQSARSQDLETIYHDAGQFYFARVAQLRIEKDLWMKNSVPLILPETEVQDLDTMTDWQLAEMKFNLLKA
jgi:N-acylneuraminate cytidylyltransferase